MGIVRERTIPQVDEIKGTCENRKSEETTVDVDDEEIHAVDSAGFES
jgi:hypothetical protein